MAKLDKIRKNISNLNRNDLLLKYAFDDSEGVSHYHVYLAATYMVTARPLGTLCLRVGLPPKVVWDKQVTSHVDLCATGPDEDTV
jgi:hypothetical protein